MAEPGTWRPCSACKKPIALGARYYVCSVSTCNRARTGLVFCDVSCWEVHLPIARHREAWAEEETAPRTAAPPQPASGAGAASKPKAAAREKAPAAREKAEPQREARRTIVRRASEKPAEQSGASDDVPKEVLIVASRLKDYVRARSGMNTSDRVLGPLSEIVRAAVDEAIERARQDERKTVLDRDVPRPR